MSDARDSLASIRWWPKDWRASTARAALSPAGRGVYLDLLFAQFLEPDCVLPDDDPRLAALAGVTPQAWAALRGKVLEWFPVVAPGKRQNARMAHEWQQALDYREAQRSSGRKGGQASVKARSTKPQAREPQASVNLPTPFRSDSESDQTLVPSGRSPEDGASPVPILVGVWNRETAGVLPTVRNVSPKSKRATLIAEAMRACPDLDRWAAAFRALAASRHHRGENDRGWKADIDFVLRGDNRDKWLDAGEQGNAQGGSAIDAARREVFGR